MRPFANAVPQPEVLRLADLVQAAPGQVVSRRIVQKAAGNVTIFAFAQGEGLSEHTAPFDAIVHVLDGEADVTIDGAVHRVAAGQAVVMPANRPHALHAVSAFRMLLTMIRSE